LGGPEVASCDDEGDAADLDRFDALARSRCDRVENGGTPISAPCLDLDLLPEADPPVAGEVECERARRPILSSGFLGVPLAGGRES